MSLRHPSSRRDFLSASFGIGAGSLGLETLLAEQSGKLAVGGSHFAPTAERVIFLFMSGGPSQVDTFDPKPELAKLAGKDVPESIAATVPKIKRAGLKNLMASPWEFQQHGESGIPVSELLPATAKHVDDLCVIRSMQHRNPVHGPGECVALTGTGAGDRPSIGAWSIYGLGSETQNLPAFVTMNLHSDGMQFPQAAGWGAGFLPPQYQGTVVDPEEGIRDVAMPEGFTKSRRRDQLGAIDWFNRRHLSQLGHHPEIEARIRSYEMAFRLQTAAPELFELSGESAATRALYGLDTSPTKQSGRGCLLARRMVERGVRYVQLRIGGWDAHGNIKGNHERMCGITDRPIAALLSDLKQRGLFDSTLVVWAGEFGRTPTMEGKANGRDHSPAGYSVWLAGGGVKGGQIIGQTDPIGYVTVDRPVSPHDFHATILHSLGLRADRLTYNHHGRDEVPTVFGGDAVTEVFG
ncbi:MAG: DUF1501 domain-containing protein [Verrucomicrobiales bacterium]|nr:DUF1501 domain-containing protein [Verrucomicrobiales bacterium]